MSKLDEIRKRLQAQDRTTRSSQGQHDNTVYTHWDLPFNGQSTVRFLPDNDPDNVFFWAEKQVIKIPFEGIIGHDENTPTTIQVPCMEMYGEQCPILNEIRPWFNTENDQIARKYWKKRSYIFQGFVIEDGMDEKDPPENPIRRFVMNTQIFKLIKAGLLDPEMTEEPVDYTTGTDFRIVKTQNGKWADYGTSTWARRESALTTEQLEAIDTYGLNTLSDFLPKKPDEDSLNAIVEMFEASVEGELYDPTRWGNYYKPFGLNMSTDSDSNNEEAFHSAKKVESTKVPAQGAEPISTATVEKDVAKNDDSDTPPSTQEILARLKQRNTAS